MADFGVSWDRIKDAERLRIYRCSCGWATSRYAEIDNHEDQLEPGHVVALIGLPRLLDKDAPGYPNSEPVYDAQNPPLSFDYEELAFQAAKVERPTWDSYFTVIARAVGARADCRRRQVGAVIVDADHRIVSTGYNGAPAGEPGCFAGHCPRGLMSTQEAAPMSAYDNCISIHAEANALLYARQSLVGATIYITCQPCRDCAKLIAGAGIKRTVYP